MLKVLWLAPFPYDYFESKSSPQSHPAPWITELSTEISKQVDLTIVDWSKKVIGVEKIHHNGINFVFVHKPKLKYDFLSLYFLRINYLKKYLLSSDLRPNIIHVHGTEHQYETIAHRTKIPYIISMQGILNRYKPYYPQKFSSMHLSFLLGSIYERNGIKNSSNFCCRTNFDSGYIRELNPNAKIYINWELIRNDFFQDCFDENSNNLIFLGGANSFKGIRETLMAFDILKKRYKMRLLICGPGHRNQIIRFIKSNRLGISGNDIDFYGFQSSAQLTNLFKKSFCLVHPSYMDNSPNSICEAQVAGLPVIASDVGGVGSLIKHNHDGLLVKRYESREIAEQIIRLKTDKDLYKNISSQSRETARKRHDRNQIVENTLKMYKEIAGA